MNNLNIAIDYENETGERADFEDSLREELTEKLTAGEKVIIGAGACWIDCSNSDSIESCVVEYLSDYADQKIFESEGE